MIPPLPVSFRRMPFKLPFSKPSNSNDKVTLLSQMKIAMVPSTGDSAVISQQQGESDFISGTRGDTITDDWLNDFPKGISPDYRPIPWYLRAWINVSSITSSIVLSNISLYAFIRSLFSANVKWKTLIKVILRAWLISFSTTAVLQDFFFSPSRIPLSQQMEEFKLGNHRLLPSRYSNLETVSVTKPALLGTSSSIPDIQSNTDDFEKHDINNTSLVTHFLRVEGRAASISCHDEENSYDILHCSHGFGASSLSWLPSLSPMVERFRVKVGLAHDAVGFGFTERPDESSDLGSYSLYTSAKIGIQLVNEEMHEIRKRMDTGEGCPSHCSRIILLGHSMGCFTTLRMAMDMHHMFDGIKVILVSPAISSRETHQSPCSWDEKKDVRSTFSPMMVAFGSLFRKFVIYPPLKYILRHVVSSHSFWKRGLSSAWGDPKRLNERDILRFRWPAVAMNLEMGLIAFARAQAKKLYCYKGGELQLLKDVTQLPNVNVSIVHGTNDPIVPISNSESLAAVVGMTSLQLLKIDGLGHDPFEEDVVKFLKIITE